MPIVYYWELFACDTTAYFACVICNYLFARFHVHTILKNYHHLFALQS